MPGRAGPPAAPASPPPTSSSGQPSGWSWPEIVKLFLQSVVFAGILAVINKVWAAKQTTVELVISWSKDRQPTWSYAVYLVTALSRAATRPATGDAATLGDAERVQILLGNRPYRPFTLCGEQAALAATALAQPPCADPAQVESADAVKLKSMLVSYFNLLEAVCAAYYRRTAHAGTIRETFGPLVSGTNPDFPHALFERDEYQLAGSYPYTTLFVCDMKDRNLGDRRRADLVRPNLVTDLLDAAGEVVREIGRCCWTPVAYWYRYRRRRRPGPATRPSA